MIDLSTIDGFEWDDGNREKTRLLHDVDWQETEEAFFHPPILVALDPTHSQSEERMFLLGRTAAGRQLTVVFTIRKKHIRVISARDMSKKERRYYHEALKEDPGIPE